MQTELFKKLTQKEKILKALKIQKMTNRQLNDICFRYGARIMELRNEGYDISTRHITKGLFEFELKEK